MSDRFPDNTSAPAPCATCGHRRSIHGLVDSAYGTTCWNRTRFWAGWADDLCPCNEFVPTGGWTLDSINR